MSRKQITTTPNLHQTDGYLGLLERLHNLSPDSPRQWGEMDVAQMLAHVTMNLELAMGTEKIKQTWMGRIFGGIAKRKILREGIPKGIPTDAQRKITDQRDFYVERAILERTLKRFHERGPAGVTRQPHDFFGPMTEQEWARLQYLHTDHHFRQFGG